MIKGVHLVSVVARRCPGIPRIASASRCWIPATYAPTAAAAVLRSLHYPILARS